MNDRANYSIVGDTDVDIGVEIRQTLSLYKVFFDAVTVRIGLTERRLNDIRYRFSTPKFV